MSISPQTLAWLRQSAAVDGAAYSQVLLHLLERVEALEQRPTCQQALQVPPTPEAAPVIAVRAIYDLGRQHGAAQLPAAQPAYRYSPVTIAECGGPCEQGPEHCDCGEIKPEPPAAQPAPPVAPAGGLVERVAWPIARFASEALPGDDSRPTARAAIREVAAWVDQQGQHGCSLREEADQ